MDMLLLPSLRSGNPLFENECISHFDYMMKSSRGVSVGSWHNGIVNGMEGRFVSPLLGMSSTKRPDLLNIQILLITCGAIPVQNLHFHCDPSNDTALEVWIHYVYHNAVWINMESLYSAENGISALNGCFWAEKRIPSCVWWRLQLQMRTVRYASNNSRFSFIFLFFFLKIVLTIRSDDRRTSSDD